MPSLFPDHTTLELAFREEREMVIDLGGYAVELAGGVLVVNERVPVPRFNFVQYVRLHRNRQTAFLERTLDHYFQRALRPSFRVERPVPDFLDTSLTRLGFRAASEPWTLLLRSPDGGSVAPSSDFQVRIAQSAELPFVAAFWAGDREREELLRALAVASEHPNPNQEIQAWVALREGSPTSAAIVHRYQGCVGIHGVVTQPRDRGQGAATALVAGLLRAPPASGRRETVAIWSASVRLNRRLESLGFAPAATFAWYELPPEAELALPPAAPPGPPRWRPPRAQGRAAP